MELNINLKITQNRYSYYYGFLTYDVLALIYFFTKNDSIGNKTFTVVHIAN